MRNPPLKTPHFLDLLQRNAKAEYANYNNINSLHFCILQFTFVLHPLVFLRSILLLDEACHLCAHTPKTCFLCSSVKKTLLTAHNSKIKHSEVIRRASLSSVCHKKRKAMHCAKKSQSIDFVRSMLWLYELEIRDFLSRSTAIPLFPQW